MLPALAELRGVPAALRVQYASRDQLDTFVLAGLNGAIEHARATVAAYGGPEYDVPPLRSLAEFTALPVLTKGRVRAAPESFHDRTLGPRDYLVVRTSGTTGSALELRHDWANFAHDRAVNVRRMLATNCYRPWHRLYQFKAWNMPGRWHERLGLFRRRIIDCNLPLADTKSIVVSRPPHVLMGYPVLLRDLLRSLTDRELTRVRGSLRLLLTDSELLTPQVRAQLVDGFGAPVFDEYSAFETLHMSFECRAGSLHLAEDRVHVEIVDEADQAVPDGTEGAVVVTGYRERAMPLLRYRLGDIAAIEPGPCDCGRTLRRLRLTQGRAEDFVVLPGGHRLYFGSFVALFMKIDGIAECMIRQDQTGDITLHLMADPRSGREFSDIAADTVAFLHRSAGRRFPVRVRRCESVERTPAGKGRFVVSEYRPD